MNGLTKTRIVVYLGAIFLAGAIAGAVGGYTAGKNTHRRPPPPDRDMAGGLRRHLESRLSLTPDQVAKINPHIDQLCSEMSSLHRGVGRQVQKAFDSFHAQIATYLTPAQKEELEKLQEEHRKKSHPRNRERDRDQNGTNAPPSDKKVDGKCEPPIGPAASKV